MAQHHTSPGTSLWDRLPVPSGIAAAALKKRPELIIDLASNRYVDPDLIDLDQYIPKIRQLIEDENLQAEHQKAAHTSNHQSRKPGPQLRPQNDSPNVADIIPRARPEQIQRLIRELPYQLSDAKYVLDRWLLPLEDQHQLLRALTRNPRQHFYPRQLFPELPDGIGIDIMSEAMCWQLHPQVLKPYMTEVPLRQTLLWLTHTTSLTDQETLNAVIGSLRHTLLQYRTGNNKELLQEDWNALRRYLYWRPELASQLYDHLCDQQAEQWAGHEDQLYDDLLILIGVRAGTEQFHQVTPLLLKRWQTTGHTGQQAGQSGRQAGSQSLGHTLGDTSQDLYLADCRPDQSPQLNQIRTPYAASMGPFRATPPGTAPSGWTAETLTAQLKQDISQWPAPVMADLLRSTALQDTRTRHLFYEKLKTWKGYRYNRVTTGGDPAARQLARQLAETVNSEPGRMWPKAPWRTVHLKPAEGFTATPKKPKLIWGDTNRWLSDPTIGKPKDQWTVRTVRHQILNTVIYAASPNGQHLSDLLTEKLGDDENAFDRWETFAHLIADDTMTGTLPIQEVIDMVAVLHR